MVDSRAEGKKVIKNHLSESAAVKVQAIDKCTEAIIKASQLITQVFKNGGKVLLCGNGGSAADCQHMASEFVNSLNKNYNRTALAALALTTDTSVLTAYANDFSFDDVFTRQIQALGKRGDLLVGISTSGNSKNIIRAVESAKSMKMHTVGLMGVSGKLSETVDVAILVPSKNTQYIQEAHLSIEHIICELVESNLFNYDH